MLMRRAALLPEQRMALAERLLRYQALRSPGRLRDQEELCRAYGVTLRTGQRYAAMLRDHRCRCAICGQPMTLRMR